MLQYSDDLLSNQWSALFCFHLHNFVEANKQISLNWIGLKGRKISFSCVAI